MKRYWAWIERGLAASLISSVALSVVFATPEERFCLVRVTLALIQGVVGALILIRRPLQISARPTEVLMAIPSFLWGAVAMSLARPWSEWPPVAEYLFMASGSGVVLSLLSLGRRFAIFPGARGVMIGGPYRFVRHPAYACELLMMIACALALGSWWGGAAVMVVALLFLVARIIVEERPLRELPGYRSYAEGLRWRLVPGVW